jgi:hypothetical protein
VSDDFLVNPASAAAGAGRAISSKSAMGDTAVYVYCIVRAATRPASRRAPAGVPGATAAEIVPLGRRLWLTAASVPLDTYGPGQLETRLRDMAWVGEVAVGHESVVEYFTRLKGATVVPAKLFTMFSTIERAIADTRARQRDIADSARRIAGCEEWGVRVVRDASSARQTRTAIEPASGAAFLAAKKRARDERIEAARAGADAAIAAFDSLAGIARDARTREDAPESAAPPPLLDAAFLVPVARRARFRTAAKRAARRCAGAGASMTLTGPWPAYNFINPSREQR